jgi:hypothetical protein
MPAWGPLSDGFAAKCPMITRTGEDKYIVRICKSAHSFLTCINGLPSQRNRDESFRRPEAGYLRSQEKVDINSNSIPVVRPTYSTQS